ncbi:MAG: MerR family transcriptional regulator [Herpetosiphon sp.]|nr:MerR family transcriptional regulator [Herpetosiphon sp.]
MLKIGEFSHISGVSIQTLRYYDTIGLLKPASVDQWTGYRLYTFAQLQRLNRILALKDMGFSLDEIASMLKQIIEPQHLRQLFQQRQRDMHQQISTMLGQLQRLELRLQLIEQEGIMPSTEVTLKHLDPVLVASRRIIVPENNGHPVGLPEAFDEVTSYVRTQRGETMGSCMAVWHTPVEANHNEDVEAVIPLVHPIAGNERITIHHLPAVEVASLLHHGAFNLFDQSYQVLLKWIEDHGYRINGAFREVYHDMSDSKNVAVEIQFPVSKI